MRFTASSTDYDFDFEKVMITESRRKRALYDRMVDLKLDGVKIGADYILDIDIFIADATDRDNFNTIFLDDFGDLTAISNIDEVGSGETYTSYQTDMIIEQPQRDLVWRRVYNQKQINVFKTKLKVVCSGKTTPTKP